MTDLSFGTTSAVIILFLLIGFLAGYLAGKKQGRLLGSLEALAEFPLIIRQNSLEEGRCLICSRVLGGCSHFYSEQVNEEKVQN